MDGYKLWGKFFYNVSYAVSDIAGCHLDDNNNLVLAATGNSQPAILELDPVTGSVLSFLSLENVGYTWDDILSINGAIYHDTKDPLDGKSYYYLPMQVNDRSYLVQIDKEKQEVK